MIRILANTVEESEGRDYEFAGRLTADLVKNCPPSLSCDSYLCGPAGFIQDMYDGLRALGVADQRILAEAFGPAALRRLPSALSAVDFLEPSRHPVRVRFEKSRVEALWKPGSGTLLDLAERLGLAPDFNCRSGSCGTCRAPLARGEVMYDARPAFDVAPGEILLCCSFPAQNVSADGGLLVVDA